ncbi:MAG: HlyD family efflux transporter periplasmic adaptor subunit [Planctomycetes bacterium]|nr:HlyD family efflux transporter periplasmic adaptor subunit [Planctomycetota bacterium]
MVRRIAVFLVIVAALAAVLLWSQQRSAPLKVSGFVEADDVRVGSRVGGRVLRVLIEEGAAVQKGDLLVELEPFDLRERLAEAQALLEARRAEHAKLVKGLRDEEIAQAKARRDQLEAQLRQFKNGPREYEIATGRARVKLAEAQLDLARLDHQRATALRADEVVSEETLDRSVRELRVAEAALEVSRNELELLLEGTRAEEIERAEAELAETDAAWRLAESGFRVEDVAEAEAAAAAAAASLAAIERRIEELAVRAPVDGVIEAIDLQPGDLVREGAPVLSLIDPARLWVRAYVPEDLLTLQPGDLLQVSVDAFPGKSFSGRVGFIAREAEFTPRNVQTPEERSEQVFRIKVMLEDGLDLLRPGMAADVWLGRDG